MTDKDEPSRAKERIDNEAPKCKKSKTANDDPTRQKLLKDKADPKFA
jgi:hypothetical protein